MSQQQQQAERTPLPRRRACNACSQAKVRCDHRSGNCGRCEVRGVRCVYPEGGGHEPSQRASQPAPSANIGEIPRERHPGDTLYAGQLPPYLSPRSGSSSWTSPDIPLLSASNHIQYAESVGRANGQISDGLNSQQVCPDLICTIDASAIQNRWLKAFIPDSDQQPKIAPHAINAYVGRMLKSYVSGLIRHTNLPPFLHERQIERCGRPSPLFDCISLIKICEDGPAFNGKMASQLLEQEMATMYESSSTSDHVTVLAVFQAYLIYVMTLYFVLDRKDSPVLRQYIMNLQQLACDTCCRGVVCGAELDHTRPQWGSWTIAESTRRTLYIMYLFDNLLCVNDNLPVFVGTELKGLPAPASKCLWRAKSEDQWKTAYNSHLADWNDSGLRIDELWRVANNAAPEVVEARRERIDRWLESVDEHTQDQNSDKKPHNSIDNSPQSHWESAQSDPVYSTFTHRQKWLLIILVSTAATFSGAASNIYFPALPTIARDLKVSVTQVNLTVTTYMVFQGLAPSIWGAVADVKGRRVAYICTFVVFFIACIGLANTQNYATLLVLRCLQSTGSASTIAIGSGVIGDISTRAERGGYMGVFQAGLLVPVAAGPVIGGALAGSLGWRSVFWFLAIYSGAFLTILVLTLPETLRTIVGDGSWKPSSLLHRQPLEFYQRFQPAQEKPQTTSSQPGKRIDILAPLRVLIDKQAFLIITFLAIYYAVWQMSITVMSTLFSRLHGLSETQIGLTFIANGVGAMVGTLTTGKLLDIDYRRAKAKHDAEAEESRKELPIERARLRLVPIFALLQCCSIMTFGWTLDQRVHISVPIISTFVTGWAAVSIQSAVSTYMIDIFPHQSASACAALNLARCLLGAGGTAAAEPLINAVRTGPAFSILTGVMVVGLGMVGVQGWVRSRAKGHSEQLEQVERGD